MSKQQQTAHKAHSKLSQLTFRATGQASEYRTKYGYDRRGRQNTVTNGSMVSTLSLSDAGQVLNEAWSGGVLNGLSVTNGYDHLLRRTNLVARNSSTPILQQSMAFDATSRLRQITDYTTGSPYSATYAYLANSPLVSQVFFTNNGVGRMTTTKQYDLLNRLTAIASASSSITSSFAYAYNTANQRTGVTNADGSFWLHQYDSLGQVTSGKKFWADSTPIAGQQFGYTFDDIGNRQATSAGADQWGANQRLAGYTANNLNQYTSRTVPRAVDILGLATNTATVTVNDIRSYRKGSYYRVELPVDNSAAPVYQFVTNLAVLNNGTNPDILTNVTGNIFVPQTPESFAYDADGNLTNDGHWSYTWDAENRLAAMAVNTAVGPQISLKFEYDHRSRRIRKQVWSNKTWSGNPTNDLRFVYDGWNLIATLDSQFSTLNSFMWGLDLSGTPQGAGGIGGLIAVSDAALGVHFAAFDGNGNVACLIKATDGTSSANNEYAPFGEVIRNTGPMTKVNPFRFSTKYQDDETDLLYYGYRYYNASTGRWISRDPLAEEGGVNLYAFVRNRATCAVDRLGLQFLHDVTLSPRQYHVNLPEGGAGRTTAVTRSISYETGPCSCGMWMKEYALHATIIEEFRESREEVANNGDLAHEDAHARVFRDYYQTISDGARVIYRRCVTLICFSAWENWWETVKTYAAAQATLANARIDYEDPGYDPARKPTADQMATFEAEVARARDAVIAAQTEKRGKCSF